jgi:hypothetical protein
MGILAGRDEGAVGEHHVGGEQVVDRQAEPAGQVADAAAEGQPGDRTGGPVSSAARYSWIIRIAVAPSPTAEATRLIDR